MLSEEGLMGSQTLEILRQGVWASLTGGWFYDPHQDVFCNTFHLYIWLFLLCLPFSIYVYFPPTKYMWYFYCLSVTIALAAIKLVNYGLHHMYDTTECIQEEVEDEWQEAKREDEGIELQDLSSKAAASTRPAMSGSLASYVEVGALPSSNAESLESTEFPHVDGPKEGKPSSTIDLKAEVHRKNSSESSEGLPSPPPDPRTFATFANETTAAASSASASASSAARPRRAERRAKHQRSKTDGFVCVTVKDETRQQHHHHHQGRSSFRKLYQESSTESQEGRGLLETPRPSLQSVGSDQGVSSSGEVAGVRRHSNFTNTSLSVLPSSLQAEIKPTGSLELGYIDKNPNQALTSEGFYFKPGNRGGVRRIRSTALETCCPPPALAVHPNSLEVIGCKNGRNPLPPPSSSLVRNQHLNLCSSYYGSEIVYPIAEQSDEHQTSHGPDTDVDSARASDSDFEENPHDSPLFYITVKTFARNVPYSGAGGSGGGGGDKGHHHSAAIKLQDKSANDERNSATSKDALLDNSTSSATPEMQDARTDCYDCTDNDVSDKKLQDSECSNLSCSNTSVECDEWALQKTAPNTIVKLSRVLGEDYEVLEDNVNNVKFELAKYDAFVGKTSHQRGKRNVKRSKKRKSSDSIEASGKSENNNNCSSLVELDLDWLFDDENHRLPLRKEPLKRESEWASAITVSLEHDVSKVLQETAPSTRSLGAIPKKIRSTAASSSSGHHNGNDQSGPSGSNSNNRKTPKSESEKCSMCRCKSDDQTTQTTNQSGESLGLGPGRSSTRSLKENKAAQTQTQRQTDSPSPVEGLEGVAVPPPPQTRVQRVGVVTAAGLASFSGAGAAAAAPSTSSSARGRSSKTAPAKERSEEASSSGSNNELSTLLPQAPFLSAFLAPRRDFPLSVCLPGEGIRFHHVSPQRSRLKRNRVNRRRTGQTRKRDNAIATSLSAGHGTHSAKSFNDTTDGSVHCFMDEQGNWVTYTFDEKGLGTANSRLHDEPTISGSLVEKAVQQPQQRRRSSDIAAIDAAAASSQSHHRPKKNSLELWEGAGVGGGIGGGADADSICAVGGALSASLVESAAASRSGGGGGVGGVGCMIPSVTNQAIHAAVQSRLRGESARMRMLSAAATNASSSNSNSQHFDPMHMLEDSLLSIIRGDEGDVDVESGGILSRAGGGGLGPSRHQFRFMQAADSTNNNYPRTKTFYKFKVFPWTFVKVTLDRLKLLALLDRNLTLGETLLSTVLGVMVSVFGATLLHMSFYEDLLAFVFCFIMASCQYSLLKSVQPDAASPTHGFNRIIAYSRPIYFCLFSAIVLVLHRNIEPAQVAATYDLMGLGEVHNSIPDPAPMDTGSVLMVCARDFTVKFILFFPVLFSLGLFPQVNTFTMYLLEQVDMHVFGGNAMSSLLASFYCIFRSVLAVLVLNGFAYGALSEPKGSRHILFSIFCACLVACSYHLSRSASDPTHLWNIIKRHVWPTDLYREHGINAPPPSPATMRREKTEIKEEKPLTSDARRRTPEKEEKQSRRRSSSREKSKDSTKSVKFPLDAEAEAPGIDHVDPLPRKLQKTVNARLKNDIILCALIALLVFGIHASTVFTALQPELSPILSAIVAAVGIVLHYVTPHLRKQLPWMCVARPVLRSREHSQYQIRGPAKIMWFERVYVYFCFVERNILYPLLFLSVVTEDAPKVVSQFGALGGSFVVVVCALKCLRSSYSDQRSQYLILIFASLFFRYDYSFTGAPFLVQYFFMGVAYHKLYELLLKVQFVVTYIAPWQITWGSAFHAFAQPFSVPHSAMLFVQAIISAVLSTPLNPFLGSAIFLTSYVRPVKFWERDYNTRRVDHSNTPLSSHLHRNLGADDNNLNSIFYEHLTRSLQHSLCGDLTMGRWGLVNQGDCFVLASDYLNCLVHVIEMGNGLVTFQMRGLEFRGTYCQQREVEAITEGIEENDACCCVETDHFSGVLSISSAFSQRWLAWEVTAAKYILEGYSISDNSAVSMLQVFEFRKVLISYYVKSIIFYTVRSPKLEEWLSSPPILKALQPMQHKHYCDLDPVFNYNIDEDYDVANSGMTKYVFFQTHGPWIRYCVQKTGKNIECGLKSILAVLCFALSILGRRALGQASHNTVSNVEFFLYGLHALFKGDFRITCHRDEWVFCDMDLLKTVVAPGVRMSLKLHQDHFMSPDEYEELPALYDAICKHEEDLVISHEGDPAWRNAVLTGTPSLLALRHVLDDGADEYKIIMLNKRHLSFRVIKINKECVRGLWAGQQQELVYLRNRNPERGSIQNAKQALRNIINSSCDQPIGYPIYVSPLTTSYAETNEQFRSLVGGSVSLTKIRNYVFDMFRRIRKRCGEGCSSGASTRDEIGMGHEGVYAMTPVAPLNHHTAGSQSTDGSHLSGSMGRGSSLSRTSLGGNRGSLVSVGKPTSTTLSSLAGLFKERDERSVFQGPDPQTRSEERSGDSNETTDKEFAVQRVRITDPNFVYDGINLGRRIDVSWPTEFMRVRGGRSFWKDWVPEVGMEGPVVHRWVPCHRDPGRRSHVDRTILLVQIDDKYVPIAESGVTDLGQEV